MIIGIQGRQTESVTEEKCAVNIGSGTLMVYATPAMLALVEKTAWLSIVDELDVGQCTVGTAIHVQHIASTPLGAKVTAETELIEVSGRKLSFNVLVYDDYGIIGKGTHERFIVDAAKFQSKTDAKRG